MKAIAVFQGDLKGSVVEFVKGKLIGLPPGNHGFPIHEGEDDLGRGGILRLIDHRSCR